MLVYIAEDQNADEIDETAFKLAQTGHAFICPQRNNTTIDKSIDGLIRSTDDSMNIDLLRRCDAIVLGNTVPHTDNQVKARDFATKAGIPIYQYPNLPDLSLTEVRAPEQCTAFFDTLMKMYRLHLTKNSDYSPINILGTGEIGLITRLWDKTARLMNLYGFDIRIQSSTFVSKRDPKHESIEDTLIDTAVYGIIGLLLRQNKWGK